MTVTDKVLSYWRAVGHVVVTDVNNNKFMGIICEIYNGYVVLSTVQEKLVWVDIDCIVSIEEI